MYWIQFLISAVVIIIGGIRLTTYADHLSDRTSIGRAWIGILLLGLITSLPEAVTSLYSVISLRAHDLAMGNLLGSNNFNPMLLVVMDIVYRRESITTLIQPKKSHQYAALIAILFTIFVIIQVLYVDVTSGLISNIIVILYFYGMFLLSKVDQVHEEKYFEKKKKDEEAISLNAIWLNIIVSAALVVVAAIFLANAADVIADKTGLGRTFVGSIFLALVTSLPEMVVSLSALKLGSIDLAIGNIFGSNMSNIFIICLCDIVTTYFVTGAQFPAGFYQSISNTHIFTALLSIFLTLIALVKIHAKKSKEIGTISLYSWFMIITFVTGTYFLYTLR